MSILVGIDGTDEYFFPSQRRNTSYDVTFHESFVSKLCRDRPPNTQYIRGPLLPGGGLLDAIDEGYNFILNRRRAGINEPILLTGYSRGAVGVVEIAKKLHSTSLTGSNLLGPSSVKVRAMLLFDAVDMHLAVNAWNIPNNVEYVLHLRRARESGSRESFETFGPIEWRVSSPTDYKQEFFRCTHACMGGVLWPLPVRRSPQVLTLKERIPPRQVPDHSRRHDPIDEGFPDYGTNVTYAQDEAESNRLWNSNTVQSFIRQHGFQ